MRLWGRATILRRMLCLWLLLLGFTLVILLLSDFFNRGGIHSLQKLGPPRRPFQRFRPPDMEVIVDSRDPALQLGVDLAPLKSLQEDQLLFVPSSQGSKSPPQKRANYKVLLPAANKDATAPGEGDPQVHLEELEKNLQLRYGFNEGFSGSLHRSLPEVRSHGCFEEQYSESLPLASVIICFHDETWSTLLRTVHSVLDTAPNQFLQEVLLVDDLSQHGHLKSALSQYMAHLEKVRLIRSSKRLGVAGCRTLGAARAAGEVLVFMDSHCECHKGWLEPLLERVAQDRTRVVSPIIDVIDWETFQYNATQWPVRGVFDWRLDFYWESNPQLQDKDPDMDNKPVQSPSLGGEVLAIDRHFFQSVGSYDPGMLLWGAEQIELSIRSESPNIAERLQLKRRLGCRNFHWYLTTVYPQLYIPQDRPGLSGELYNVGTGSCADYSRGQGLQGGPMIIAPCSGTGSQHCDLNFEGEVRWGPMGALCLDAKLERVVLSPCPILRPTTRRLQWKFIKAR
ncbi:Polypeptide N-acetylgalactosaminyltransferase 15 [Channa argus]|uniref:Polypeptide N-acetylgalactosaminyltransferase n=1 Tax=Channa argus TaxID=215402 RepID=A0A6G1QZE2_CHAAH|nr:Polypeptide N-acetylgalactosaminyltransferase 15 [Channa argus]